MKLYVLEKDDVYYQRVCEGHLVFTEQIKDAHFFGEEEHAVALEMAKQHRCDLTAVEFVPYAEYIGSV